MIEYLPQAITSFSAAGNIAKTLFGLRDENLLNSKVIDLQRCIIEFNRRCYLGKPSKPPQQ
jgi:hypothetical protein